jgi:hypothetical protein
VDPAYLSAVERAFLARAGRGLMLSPADVALVERWARAEMPVAVVLDGLEAAFARPPSRPVRGLAFARAAIESAYAAHRARMMGGQAADAPAAPSGAALADRVAQRLAQARRRVVAPALLAALEEAEGACRAAGGLIDAGAVDRIEHRLLERAREALSPADLGAILEDIDNRWARERRGSTPEAWHQVREAQLARALRARLGLDVRLAEEPETGF